MSETSTTTLRGRVRDRLPFDSDVLLSRPVRRFFLSTLLGAFGTGTIFALFVLYCVHIRHVSPTLAGTMLAWEAILGAATAPLYGTIVDRHGPSIVLTVTMPVVALGLVGIGFASTVPMLFGVATVISAGGAGMWTCFNVFITRIVAEEHRQDAFGVNFMLINVGIGLGSIVGTSIVSLHDLRSFQVAYCIAGLLTLADSAVLFTLRGFGGRAEGHEHRRDLAAEGWLTVLKDRRMVRFVLFSLVLMVCGYGSIEAGIPLLVTGPAHLSVHTVGLLIAFNTFTIIVAQLFVLGRIRGRSRSMLIGLVGLLWGASWLLATSSLAVGTIAAVGFLCVGQILFALGETIFQPTSPALVNELAPEHLRGRYNALIGMVWAVSAAIGAVIATTSLGHHAATAWTIGLAAGAILGGLGVTTMRHSLTAAEDGLEIAQTN